MGESKATAMGRTMVYRATGEESRYEWLNDRQAQKKSRIQFGDCNLNRIQGKLKSVKHTLAGKQPEECAFCCLGGLSWEEVGLYRKGIKA